jgi:hypothetical protein
MSSTIIVVESRRLNQIVSHFDSSIEAIIAVAAAPADVIVA